MEEGERRLGGGPGTMEGGLPWGEQPYSFNGLLCLSYKLAKKILASAYSHVCYKMSSADLKACREAKKLVVMRGHLVVG